MAKSTLTFTQHHWRLIVSWLNLTTSTTWYSNVWSITNSYCTQKCIRFMPWHGSNRGFSKLWECPRCCQCERSDRVSLENRAGRGLARCRSAFPSTCRRVCDDVSAWHRGNCVELASDYAVGLGTVRLLIKTWDHQLYLGHEGQTSLEALCWALEKSSRLVFLSSQTMSNLQSPLR